MTEKDYQQTRGSSGLGLTFVRPLPQGGSAPTGSSETPSSFSSTFTLSDHLFPPRGLEDSDGLPPVAGLELGHFVIEERIGRGGMGAVFRAMDKRLARIVALKVLTSEHSHDPEAVLRFQNEARAAARLDHENISRVFYIGEQDGLHFIAFEFVTGTNVRNFIQQKGFLTAAESVNFTLQIAEALRHTNAANVVHRDIKPSNIIISPSGRAKLVDLGLARHNHSEMSRELTTVGTALGTFDYIAPEQALDARNVDVRSDIYSLGCTLYHMLTGNPPYPTGTMFEKVMNHHRPVPPDPSEKNHQVSPQLARVVQKMMAANPDERYATPDSLIGDLVLIADSMGLQPTPPDSMVWQMPLFDRRASRWNGTRTWSAVALILLLLVLADRIQYDAPRNPLKPNDSDVTALTKADSATPVRTPLLPDLGEPSNGPPTSTSPATHPSAFSPASKQIAVPELNVPPSPEGSSQDALLTPLDLADAWWNHSTMIRSIPRELPPGKPTAPDESLTPGSVSGTAQMPVVSTRSELPPVETRSSSETASTAPMPPTTPALPPVAGDSFIVVDPVTEERLARSTLPAACAAARDGWIIEVRAGSAPLVVDETILITDKRLTIRRAGDFQPGKDPRPVLRVDLSSQLLQGSLSRSADLFQLTRGTIELSDLDLELIVDSSAIANWSFATLTNSSRLYARGVSFTIVNPANSRAMLANLPQVEAPESRELIPERMQPRSNVLELKDCVVRGQGDFVTQENSAPLSIELHNTALALSGSIVRIDGSDSNIMEMESPDRRMTELLFDHVTMVTGRGLLTATSGDYGTLPRIEIGLNDSVIRVTQHQQPLLELSGGEDYELLRDKVHFKENQSPSFLELSGPFSSINSTQSRGQARELSTDQMGVNNLHVIRENLVGVSSDIGLSDWHRVQPSALNLREGHDNPALSSSPDILNAGVNWKAPAMPNHLPKDVSNAGAGR